MISTQHQTLFPASSNPDADADISKYRKYGIVDVFKNKGCWYLLKPQGLIDKGG